METSNHGRLIEFKRSLDGLATCDTRALPLEKHAGQALILEPRTIRHQERVEDLFYLLFRRTGS